MSRYHEASHPTVPISNDEHGSPSGHMMNSEISLESSEEPSLFSCILAVLLSHQATFEAEPIPSKKA